MSHSNRYMAWVTTKSNERLSACIDVPPNESLLDILQEKLNDLKDLGPIETLEVTKVGKATKSPKKMSKDFNKVPETPEEFYDLERDPDEVR